MAMTLGWLARATRRSTEGSSASTYSGWTPTVAWGAGGLPPGREPAADLPKVDADDAAASTGGGHGCQHLGQTCLHLGKIEMAMGNRPARLGLQRMGRAGRLHHAAQEASILRRASIPLSSLLKWTPIPGRGHSAPRRSHPDDRAGDRQLGRIVHQRKA